MIKKNNTPNRETRKSKFKSLPKKPFIKFRKKMKIISCGIACIKINTYPIFRIKNLSDFNDLYHF